MHDFELAKDGCGVVGEDHLLQVVDDNFVAAEGAKGGLYRRGDGAAGVDVAEDGAILGVIAGRDGGG